MMRRTAAVWVLVLALGGCGRSYTAGTHGSGLESETEPTCEDGSPLGEQPVSAEEAACLGLTEPACVGCHTREGTTYLRPLCVPPPPDVTPLVPPGDCVDPTTPPPPPPPLDPEAEVVLTDEQAACLGLDRPPCVSCHRRHDVLVLRPIGVPAPPPDVALPDLSRCL